MNQHIKSRYLVVASIFMSLFTNFNTHADDSFFCPVVPTIIPRSQGRDAARRSVGLLERIYLTDQDDWWGNFDITGEYTRTFRPNKIVSCLFGADVLSTTSGITPGCELESCNTRCIRIQGSRVADRQSNAWLADYFYLPTDFDSTVCFNPKIQNVIVDFDFYMGLDPWVCNMYFRMYGPLTWTKWDLGFCEVINNAGTNSHPEGYFSPQSISRDNLLTSFESYASGNTPGLLTSSFGNTCFDPLHFSRMSRCSETRLGFADLRVELGWNPFYTDCYTVGFALLAAAPTGNNKRSCLLFEPIVGNAHHWEFGADLHWLQQLWCCEENGWAANFFLDANVTHLFGTYQQRTFDLCNKPNSKYMLAERLSLPNVGGLKAFEAVGLPASLPLGQFKDVFVPVANLTTINVKTSISAEAEIVAMFNFTTCNWDFDLGYNFWVRACEDFECPENCKQKFCLNLCQTGEEFTWALKGDARVYGFVNEIGQLPLNTPVALSATESKATIHTGTNATNGQAGASELNLGVDNHKPAFGSAGTPQALAFETNLPISTNQINTSLQPVFIRCPEDINFQRTRSMSHKVFGNISYNWWDKECWIPFLGVGGFAEFGRTDTCRPFATNDVNCCTPFTVGSCDKECDPCATTCIDCTISQWGVWVKGGVSF